MRENINLNPLQRYHGFAGGKVSIVMTDGEIATESLITMVTNLYMVTAFKEL